MASDTAAMSFVATSNASLPSTVKLMADFVTETSPQFLPLICASVLDSDTP